MGKVNAEEVKVGCYQVLTLLLLSVNFVTVAMSHVVSIFYRQTPKIFCQEEGREYVRNRTYGCPQAGAACPGSYGFEATTDHERTEWTVAMEWGLVCEHEPLMKAASHVYYGGLLLGGLVAGALADRLGRLPVLAVCLYAQGIMTVALYAVQNYKFFLLFRGLQGLFIQGLESCSFILCMELFPARFRTLVALIVLSMRSFGYALLAGLNYVVPDWRMLQLVISVPTAVTVLYIWILPESPRWLMARGKSTEAELLLERIAKYNSLCSLASERKAKKTAEPEGAEKPGGARARPEDARNLDETHDLLDSARPETSSTVTVSLEDEACPGKKSPSVEEKDKAAVAYDHSTARRALNGDENAAGKPKTRWAPLGFLESRFTGYPCLILICLWFTSSMAFHALIAQPQRSPGVQRVNLALAGCLEFVSFLLSYGLITSRFGRRRSLCAAQLLIGVSCLTIAVLAIVQPHYSPGVVFDWIGRVKNGILVLGRIANVSTFFILRLLVIEFFPTTSRGIGVGLCIAAEMIGGLVMLYLADLSNYVLELLRFLIGLFGICAGLLTLIFPETSYDILPDSVEDAKRLGQKSKNATSNIENGVVQRSKNPEVLREKLFSEDWVDAGNGIIVNFTENKNQE